MSVTDKLGEQTWTKILYLQLNRQLLGNVEAVRVLFLTEIAVIIPTEQQNRRQIKITGHRPADLTDSADYGILFTTETGIRSTNVASDDTWMMLANELIILKTYTRFLLDRAFPPCCRAGISARSSSLLGAMNRINLDRERESSMNQ